MSDTCVVKTTLTKISVCIFFNFFAVFYIIMINIESKTDKDPPALKF